MKKYIGCLFTIALLGFTSCEKFLEEDFKSGVNSDSITNSEQTFETLINSAYMTLRVWYGKENGWDLTESGTDIYTYGLDNRAIGFNTYESFTTSEEQERMGAVWRELYKALNVCNIILSRIDEVPYEDEDLKEQRRGEVSFLRAHYLWMIAETWGGVHFTTEPSEVAVHTANRTPVETFYQQIFDDLQVAVENLPETVSAADYGRPTKAAAEAMLARCHLYRGNYTEASTYAQNVINNYNFALLDDWSDIWAIDNIKNSEVVWAVNYSDDATFTTTNLYDTEGDLYNAAGLIQRSGGNTGHLMYEIRYENLSWGMVRDLENGRGFQRWGPTRFLIDLYNENIDERFYGSFKTTWLSNSAAAIPKWRGTTYWVGNTELPVPPGQDGQPLFELGDTSIVFSKTPVPASEKARFNQNDIRQFDPESGYLIIDINDMYLPNGSFNNAVINRQFYFPITKKYQDPERLEIATQHSKRDIYVFRISEMYLIAAEAEMLGGSMGTAIEMMNTLRVARSVEGQENDMRITAADMDIDFVLDERARELATEFQRFFDLKRTGKLVERVQSHNPDAAPYIQAFHNLRFIPQNQIDAMTNGMDYQNPGY